MIECESCKRYFHADEIDSCPECGAELCEHCYQNHVKNCVFNNNFDDDSKGVLDSECPQCGKKLELDIDDDRSTLICNGCSYELDVTDELTDCEEEEREDY